MNGKRTSIILLGGWMIISLAASFVRAQNAPGRKESFNVLTQAVQILNLTPEVAERHYPVQLRGVVTCFDQRAELCFVQDSTAGIYVYTKNQNRQYKPGDLVEVAGMSGAGLFSPIILLGTLNVTGSGALPEPKAISIEQLASGKEDSQWVQVEGIVQRVVEDWGHLVLDVVSGGSRLKARVLNYPEGAHDDLLDARVRVNGVAGTSYNNKRQRTGFHLLVPSLEQVKVLSRSQTDPFTGPVRPSGSLLAYSREEGAEHRVRLRAVVTLRWPGQALFVRDESGGIQIQSDQKTDVEVGDVIDIVGFPALGGYTPVLKDALFRKVDKADPPQPVRISAAAAFSGDHDKDLVQMEATLVARDETHDGRETLVLQNEKRILQAYLPKRSDHLMLAPLVVGSRLQITGICTIDLNEGGKPGECNLWLRSPQDISVLQLPSWWKISRLAWGVGGLGIAFLVGLLWVGSLRQSVRHKTEAIRRREVALENRFRDLFENANDIIFTVDPAGRLTSLNKAGEQILGFTREEALQKSIVEMVVPEQRESFRQHLEKPPPHESGRALEMQITTKGGERLTLEVNCRPNYQEDQPFGIQCIARDITARKGAEAALRQSEQQLRKSLEDKERIGRDLHDGIIQSIYAVGLNLEDCKRFLKQNPADVERRLGTVLTDLNSVISEVRNFILGLESNALKGQEFRTALKSLILTLGETNSARFNLQIDSAAAERLNSKQATELLLIAREAISNSIRHAAAKRTVLILQPHDTAIRFEVRDDGKGFNTQEAREHGLGLRNMAARAQNLEASFAIFSQVGGGTRIVLDIPKEKPHLSP